MIAHLILTVNSWIRLRQKFLVICPVPWVFKSSVLILIFYSQVCIFLSNFWLFENKNPCIECSVHIYLEFLIHTLKFLIHSFSYVNTHVTHQTTKSNQVPGDQSPEGLYQQPHMEP